VPAKKRGAKASDGSAVPGLSVDPAPQDKVTIPSRAESETARGPAAERTRAASVNLRTSW